MWVINVWMLLMFFFNQASYQVWKAQGYGCFANVPINGQLSTDPEPPCFYDLTNTN
jgi:hypothetical protein